MSPLPNPPPVTARRPNGSIQFEQIRKWDSATKAFDKLLQRYKI